MKPRTGVFFAMALLVLLVSSCTGGKSQSSAAAAVVPAADKAVIRVAKADEVGKAVSCVIDGMKFDVAKGALVADFQGKTYYFCAPGEDKLFSADPLKYITNSAKTGSMDMGGMK